jgi:2-iminobutanoate/2-iminopropanoate deaminase
VSTSDPTTRPVDGTVNRTVDPAGIAPPAANYAHAIVSTAPRRWLHTSGVVPVSPDGTVPAALVDQAETVWANIDAMLSDAGMTPADIVSVTTYVTPGHPLGPVMAVRDRVLGGRLAASTLVVVAELARPAWLLEIQVVAAA